MKFYYLVFSLFSSTFYSQYYTSQWYGMDQGLPQNSVKDITKDKYGFIWMSTEGGIVRYDGTSFLLYNDFKVSNLNFKDFIGYGKEGLVCFNNGEKDGVLISNRTVKVLPKEKISRTYLLTKNKQYKRFYKNSPISEFFPDVDYYCIKTNSGTYLFDNQEIEYESLKGSKKTVHQNFRHAFLKNAFEQNNVVYIADCQKRRTMILKNGTVSYDNQPSLYNDPKTKIYWHQETRQVFIINDDNIYISKVINGKPTLKFLMRYKNIEELFLYCIFYDEETNKMYFGDVVKGLNIVNLSNFYISQKNIPYSGEFCYEALPFTQNSVITKQGIEYYRDKTNQVYSEIVKYDKRYLLYDNSQNLLYLEFNKLQRRYKSSQYQKKDSISFSGKSVEGLYKIGENYMVNIPNYKWDYYLKVFPDDTFKKAKNIFKFKENINFVTQYDNDLFYVGTSNGIYLLSLSKNKILKYLAKDLPVKEIQRTKDGNFWFTTYNKGFYLLKNNEVIRMPEDKNGFISSAHHILEDHHGVFWISSNNGLFRVSKKKLLDYAQNKNSKVTYYRYTKENGFLNNEFNGSSNPSGNILENGEFVFPSMEGFVFFKPDEIKNYYPKKSQFYIERARTGGEIINFKDTLRLKSNYKNADIFIDIPYYYNIENIYIEAKLENEENNTWEEVDNKKFTLNNINPGNYTLLVRFLVADSKFTYKRIFLEIKPFFYQTMFFKIFVLLLIITAIAVIIQVQTNFLRIKNKKLQSNLQSRNQELKETNNTLEITQNKLKNEAEYQQKIMESISHDITTPVKFIALLSKKLSVANDPFIQKKYFDSIYKTSEHLFKFTLNLKEYTELYREGNIFDGEEYCVYDLAEDKKLLFEEVASDKNTVIKNLCDPSLKIKINKNIISAILHNLIDNAVKNTTAGKILITTFVNEDAQVEIGISDTGEGMTETQIEYYSYVFESMKTENFVFKNYGLGLHMVVQLSEKINATLSFLKNTPKGTIVKIFLKK